jgi:thiamine-phosphate pyrophosphorylase
VSAAARYSGLHVLADDDPRWKRDPVEQARAACAGGAAVIQLRAKHTGDRQVLAWAHEIRTLTRDAGAAFVVNDRFDLALLCDADAVHLGQEDLAPSELPEQARERLAIGRSTHSLDQARRACDETVDYVAFGPLFGTSSKDSPYPAQGLDALAEIASQVAPRPVVAIGGIDADGARRAVQAGARGAAVISVVAGADDMERATRSLVDALGEAGVP